MDRARVRRICAAQTAPETAATAAASTVQGHHAVLGSVRVGGANVQKLGVFKRCCRGGTDLMVGCSWGVACEHSWDSHLGIIPKTGTSMAAPVVGGLLLLLRQVI